MCLQDIKVRLSACVFHVWGLSDQTILTEGGWLIYSNDFSVQQKEGDQHLPSAPYLLGMSWDACIPSFVFRDPSPHT